MKAIQRLGSLAALLTLSLPAFAVDVAQQVAPADGWGAGTVGGSAATPEHIYTVRNRTELLNALANGGNAAKIIKVAGTIDMTEGTPFANTADQKVRARVRLPSNTTLIGEGPGAGFVNAWIDITSVSQVIVRNLHIVAPCDVGPVWDPTDGALGNWNSAFDAIGIVTATQVWIDRNTITDAPVTDDTLPVENGKTRQCHDGAIDITKGADLVTVSYNVVTAHDKSMLIGGSDSQTSDAGKLRITIANNVFNGVTQRVPRVRFGQVHVFNNYFVGSKTASPYAHSYSIGVGKASNVLSQANAFAIDGASGCNSVVVYASSDHTGIFQDSGSTVNGAPLGACGVAAGTAFTPGYAFKPRPVALVKANALAQAGAGKLTTQISGSGNVADVAGTRVPAANESGVHTDTRLALSFDAPPATGTTGKVNVYRASDDQLVDSIDVSNAPSSSDTQTVLARTNLEIDALGLGAMPDGATWARYVWYRPVSVKGNTASVKLHSNKLDFGTTYYVTMDASVLNGTIKGAAFAGVVKADNWKFTTRAAPASFTSLNVDDSGSAADFRTLQGALNWVMKHCSTNSPAANGCNTVATSKTIHLGNGSYPELNILRKVSNLSIVGESRDGVVVGDVNFESLNSGSGASSASAGTTLSTSGRTVGHRVLGGGRAAFLIETSDLLTLQNFTLKNPHERSTAWDNQAETIYFNTSTTAAAARLVAKQMNFFSQQDTLQLKGYNWFYQSLIAGNVDFIWGSVMASLFEDCEIRSVVDTGGSSPGYILQSRATAGDKGFVFLNSVLTADAGVTQAYLARSGGTASTTYTDNIAFVNTRVGPHILPVGWCVGNGTSKTGVGTGGCGSNPPPWSGTADGAATDAAGWREFGSMDPSGAPLDVGARLGIAAVKVNNVSTPVQLARPLASAAGLTTRVEVFQKSTIANGAPGSWVPAPETHGSRPVPAVAGNPPRTSTEETTPMTQPRNPSRARLSLCAAAVLTLVNNAQAQSEAPTPTAVIERIQVTGSSIKRLAGETALPVSVLKSEELEARGHTELKDLLLELPQSQSLGTNSGAAGPVLNLRGLGPMRTLTLLNGRRLANEPLQDQYVSANVIPRMALQRAETLRDGASSIYGSDAIGGVQNFVTYGDFKGAKIKFEQNSPARGNHGATHALGVIGGIGDLATDGWNVYAALDHQTKSALFQGDRPELYDGTALNQLGLLVAPSNKNQSPAANWGFSAANNQDFNSSFATGCVAPYSLPTLGANSVAATPTYSPGCYRDPNFYTAVTDGSKITTMFGKASMNLGQGHRVSAEVLHSAFTVQKYRGMQLPSANEPFTYYTIPSTSKFYPGKGITPLVNVTGNAVSSRTQYIDAVKTPGTPVQLVTNNRPIFFQWGPGELGSAYRNDEQTSDRVVLSAEGTVWNWDYRVGLNYGHSQRDTRTGGGYILYSKAQEGFTNGILNPFGAQDAAGLAYLKSIEVQDYTYRFNEAFNKAVDFTLTRELMELGGGPLTVAVSGELRRDEAKVHAAPLDYVAKLPNGNYNISSAGVVLKDDIVGENPTGVAAKLNRRISSAVIELDAPLTKMWSINGAVRSDTYSDLKTTTVNPKLSLRFQPTAEVMLRASANTGFRAPSIMDIQNPTPEVRQVAMDDPVLCPSTTPLTTNTGTPVAGFTAQQVCNVTTDYWTKSPDNSHLKPEKSKGWSFGGAFEPVRGLLVTVDYWGIKLNDVLGALTLAEVQQQPAKYAANILRKADGTIDHILTSQANRGDMDMRGLDIAATYQLPTSSFGTFNFKLDGTYYDKYSFSVEKGGEMLADVGILTGDARYTGPNIGLATMQQIIYRWKHTASVGWRLGKLSAQLSQRYSSGLNDLTPRAGSTYTDVKPYKQYNLSVAYALGGIKLTVGINNLTNVYPVLTANTGYNGYLTSGADVLGRSYRFVGEYTF